MISALLPLMSKEVSTGEGFDFKNEKYVVSYLLPGQGPASPLINSGLLIFGISVHRE